MTRARDKALGARVAAEPGIRAKVADRPAAALSSHRAAKRVAGCPKLIGWQAAERGVSPLPAGCWGPSFGRAAGGPPRDGVSGARHERIFDALWLAPQDEGGGCCRR